MKVRANTRVNIVEVFHPYTLQIDIDTIEEHEAIAFICNTYPINVVTLKHADMDLRRIADEIIKHCEKFSIVKLKEMFKEEIGPH